ncbi:hypothetical protein AB0H83_16780 [Dactylosporangium sp. NPDC050688]|uniref:hypothetical protein n=1 Tax=Dactylosporangium sp. NPDC050688 TaxID=3157217 RepID=UPI0033EC320E
MTDPYQQRQPDPAYHGTPPAPPPFPAPHFAAQPPARPPRDKLVVPLIVIVATLLVLCLAGAAGAVYFLREEPGDDKTSEVVVHRPLTGG